MVAQLKKLVVALKEIGYSGGHIGRDLRFGIDVNGNFTFLKKKIKAEKNYTVNRILRRTTIAEGEKVDFTIGVSLIEQDLLLDIGQKNSAFTFDATEAGIKKHVIEIEVKEGKKKAVFSFQIEAAIKDAEFSRFDQMLAYIHQKMLANAQSRDAQAVKDALNHGDALLARTLWVNLVGDNAKWDYQYILKKKFKLSSPADYWSLVRGSDKWELRYDAWSKIHYGFIERAIGFNDQTLQDYAASGLPGTGANDEGDILSMQIGADLWDAVQTGLTQSQLHEAVLSRLQDYLDIQQENSNVNIVLGWAEQDGYRTQFPTNAFPRKPSPIKFDDPKYWNINGNYAARQWKYLQAMQIDNAFPYSIFSYPSTNCTLFTSLGWYNAGIRFPSTDPRVWNADAFKSNPSVVMPALYATPQNQQMMSDYHGEIRLVFKETAPLYNNPAFALFCNQHGNLFMPGSILYTKNIAIFTTKGPNGDPIINPIDVNAFGHSVGMLGPGSNGLNVIEMSGPSDFVNNGEEYNAFWNDKDNPVRKDLPTDDYWYDKIQDTISIRSLFDKIPTKTTEMLDHPGGPLTINFIPKELSIVPAQPMTVEDLPKYGLNPTSLATEPTYLTDRVDLAGIDATKPGYLINSTQGQGVEAYYCPPTK